MLDLWDIPSITRSGSLKNNEVRRPWWIWKSSWPSLMRRLGHLGVADGWDKADGNTHTEI